MAVILEPTKEIKAICDDAERLIRAYLETPHPKPGGRFEAEVEAYSILKLIVRYTESVVELARHDLVLLPAATVVARASFEASVLTRWMLRPVDPYEREVRCGKELGEFITPASWCISLEVAWKSLYVTASEFLYWIEADVSTFISVASSPTFDRHLNELQLAK